MEFVLCSVQDLDTLKLVSDRIERGGRWWNVLSKDALDAKSFCGIWGMLKHMGGKSCEG